MRRILGLFIALMLATGLLAVRARDDDRTRDALVEPVRTERRTTTTAAPTTTTTTAPVTTTTAPPQGPPVAATDPDGLAVQLATAIDATRNPATPEAVLAHQAHVEQVVYLALVDRPDWHAHVLDRLTPGQRAVASANLHAGTELRLLAPKPRDTLPANWVIETPRPASELLGYYKEGEAQTGIPWPYLASINLVETRMGRIHGLSSAGAQGPMQFMPQTWARFGQGDVNNPRDAILAAARYLKYNNAPVTMDTALWNYNRSWHYVRAIMAYADQMKADERAFAGYYHWQVYYRTGAGPQLLPEGWRSPGA